MKKELAKTYDPSGLEDVCTRNGWTMAISMPK